jgi:hypothetical protein
MRRSIVILAVGLSSLAPIGCASSPWSSSAAKPAAAPPVAAAPPAAPVETPAPTPQAMLAAMAELQQIGALDQAAQEQLMNDLRQTEPSLWPLLIQQVRASVAYRRRAEERDAALAQNQTPVAPVAAPVPVAAAIPAAVSVPAVDAAAALVPAAASEPLMRLPPTQLEPTPPPSPYPAAPHPPIDARRPAPGAEQRAEVVANDVRSVSYETTPTADWKASIAAAIADLERQSSSTPQSPEDITRLTQLRMLYLLAGQRDAALQPIPSAPPATQEFVAKSLYGFDTWLDVGRTPDATRRAAETKRAMEEAIGKLSETAPLVVRSLAFCSEIQSFGSYKPFKANEFSPDQELLLYAEVDNFASESTPRGYHTALRSGYQIFDARGQRVAEHDFTVTEENCQNQRRDFFIGYHLRLPKRIYSGKHTLQLTIEDLKSHKVGQSQIDFLVKETKEK